MVDNKVFRSIAFSVEKYYGAAIVKTLISTQEKKTHVVALKLAAALVVAIDREAMREGLTRSAIIRRTLLQRYHLTVAHAAVAEKE